MNKMMNDLMDDLNDRGQFGATSSFPGVFSFRYRHVDYRVAAAGGRVIMADDDGGQATVGQTTDDVELIADNIMEILAYCQ